MNWLARMDIDLHTARSIGANDNYGWHQRIWECFPDAPDSSRDFLTRIDALESSMRLWILSRRKPVRPDWCPEGSFALKEISRSFLSHSRYAFDLRANPTRTPVAKGSDGKPLLRPDGKRAHGRRVLLTKREDIHAWLLRKASDSGFKVLAAPPLEIGPVVECHFRAKDRSGFHGGVQFRGALEVEDREKFIHAYCSGIGSAKGFGFGLLLLAPLD